MDLKDKIVDLLNLVGGIENIDSVTHCSTRLRLFIIDKSLVNLDEIKKNKNVLGVVFKTNELQIVLGKNVIPYYNEVSKVYDASHTTKNKKELPQEKKKISDIVDIVVGFVSASVTPMIPGLVAGGMLKVFLLLATLAYAPFEKTSAYVLLGQLANIPFYFMPVFVAYGVSKKLGSTSIYAMAVAGALVYPDFINMLSNSGGKLTLFMIPVMKVSYASTLLPALLIGLFAAYCEKALTKIIPGILKTVLVGMLTMSITYIAGVTVLGPLGDFVGSYVVNIFLWLSTHFGPLAVGLLSACMPWLVMTGMHHAVTPFMVQAFSNPGYDVFFRPSYILHNMAEGGACIGVALKTKNKEFKAECLSLAFGCIVAGVTEPALYGVNFKLKKPMIGIMAGAGAGGIVAGLLGATAYVYGYSTILALPIFEHTMFAMLAAVIVAIVLSALVTYILGFEEENEPEKTTTVDNHLEMNLTPCVKGEMIDLSDVDDELFASGAVGQGVAFIPEEGVLYAPCDGKIISIFPTGHAIGMETDSGLSILMHIGIDTVKMNGKGFKTIVNPDQVVHKGDKLVEFDIDLIKKEGYDPTVMFILPELDASSKIDFQDNKENGLLLSMNTL